MKGALKHILFVFPFLFICLACKKEMPVRSGFELSATTENNTVILNWTPVFLSGFKSVNIYRSVSPIPDPLFNKPIDPTLLIGTIADRTVATFRDSSVVLGSGGTVYYKVVLNLENRVISSNEEQASLNGFSISYNSPGSSNGSHVTTFPEKNLFYIFNNNAGTLSVIDYSQKKILKTASFNQWGILRPVINNGNAELFMMNNNYTISCYDGLTLMYKYSISILNGTVRDWQINDNYLYVLYAFNSYTVKVRTYDLSNQTLVGEKTVHNNYNYLTCHLFACTQSNKLFFKYYTEFYNGGVGFSVYRNVCVKYNLVNHLPADSVIVTHAVMKQDSLNSGSYYNIQPSADGNYMTCNDDGEVLSFADNSIHNVSSVNISNPKVSYSHDGNFLLVKQNSSGFNANLMEVYALPGFNLVASLKSPNSTLGQNTSSMLKDDFLDNDSLVSYNLKHTFSNNQTKSVFTVFFNRID
ncbi:MAG: hypothetical protein K0S26_983 [Bacteroidota bacterium]|jgi:hypothetical protein|nr:hypothetical protein [Bacteroidota bacterium]